jgi:arylsulfatase A-like enzyme
VTFGQEFALRSGCILRLKGCLALVPLFLLGCTAAPTPNILIVLIDTFRADRVGAYGSTRSLTPFLDELAAEGTLFERAYSTSAWTPPAVASLFTSRHPAQHRITALGSVLDDSELTLAESLRPLGYRTAGFSTNLFVRQQTGFGQGFDRLSLHLADLEGRTKQRATFLEGEVLRWLDENPAGSAPAPTLLYLHFMDTHSPYEPSDPMLERFAPGISRPATVALNERLVGDGDPKRFATFTDEDAAQLAALYDAEVAGLDAALRGLFEQLSARGFLDDAIVVVLSDHGEEFGEHGRYLHGGQLFEESVRIPLLVSGAGIPAGQRVTQNVSIVDVAPTLLDLLGRPVPASFEGRSLAPLLTRKQGQPEPVDVYLDVGRTGPTTHTAGLVRGSRKLVADRSGGVHVFDLGDDPAEASPLSPSAVDASLETSFRRARERLAAGSDGGPADSVPVDEATRERLRALGYTEGSAEASEPH